MGGWQIYTVPLNHIPPTQPTAAAPHGGGVGIATCRPASVRVSGGGIAATWRSASVQADGLKNFCLIGVSVHSVFYACVCTFLSVRCACAFYSFIPASEITPFEATSVCVKYICACFLYGFLRFCFTSPIYCRLCVRARKNELQKRAKYYSSPE